MEENTVTCCDCGAVVEEEDSRLLSFGVVCDSCLEGYFCCDSCGEDFPGDAVNYIDERFLCGDCYNEQYTTCDACGEELERDCAYTYDGYETYCEACFHETFGLCDACGRTCLLEDMAYDEYSDAYRCDECGTGRHIHNYGYKPDPAFRGDGPLYFGIEIEAVSMQNARLDDTAEEVSSTGFFYCKDDSSIEGCGFEVVSHPADMNWWNNNRQYVAGMFSDLIQRGFRSHDDPDGSCGLHVHMSRRAFKSEGHILKFILFMELFKNPLTVFSRRKGGSLSRWARFLDDYAADAPLTERYKKFKAGSTSRYRAVNLCARGTVEVRIFKGTLNVKTFYATLQLLEALFEYTKKVTLDQYYNNSWTDFVAYAIKGRPDLEEYLIERGIDKMKVPAVTPEVMPCGPLEPDVIGHHRLIYNRTEEGVWV